MKKNENHLLISVLYKNQEDISARGENPEELLDFISTESSHDEFLRNKRDLERDITFYKNRILEMSNSIVEEMQLLDECVEELKEVYQKSIDDGCSKEDNVH